MVSGTVAARPEALRSFAAAEGELAGRMFATSTELRGALMRLRTRTDPSLLPHLGTPDADIGALVADARALAERIRTVAEAFERAGGAGALDGAVVRVPAVRLAVSLAGAATAADLRAIAAAGAQAVARWWTQLDTKARRALLARHGRALGAMDGLPPAVRDAANRPRVEAQLAALRRDLARLGDPAGWDRAAQARAQRLGRLLASHEAILRHTVLRYDEAGSGRAVVAVGDVAAAERVAVLVPGMTNSLATMEGLVGRAETFAERARVYGDAAVVLWLGYDSPQIAQVWNAASAQPATDGAPDLQRFVEGVRAAHAAEPFVMVSGHSYGSVVTGHAAAAGLDVDALVLLGSPGAAVSTASELALREGAPVYAGTTDDDWILGVFEAPGIVEGIADRIPGVELRAPEDGPHGRNPTDPLFGATPLPLGTASGHGQYYDPGAGNLSLENQARILAGEPVLSDR